MDKQNNPHVLYDRSAAINNSLGVPDDKGRVCRSRPTYGTCSVKLALYSSSKAGISFSEHARAHIVVSSAGVDVKCVHRGVKFDSLIGGLLARSGNEDPLRLWYRPLEQRKYRMNHNTRS